MGRGGFSWKRAVGISGAKAKLSRKIGVPLTKSGRQRKYGAAMGCSTFLLVALAIVVLAGAALSHPGRTDMYGGHTDSKTGVYHYHGGGSASSSSYTTSTVSSTTVSPSSPTVDDLISQLSMMWLSGDLQGAMNLCDQIKTALAVKMSEDATSSNLNSETAFPLTSPMAVNVGPGITAMISFPTTTAYTMKETYSGNYSGSVVIDMPNAMNLDNKLFKAGQIVLSATYLSSNPSAATISDKGSLIVKGPGESLIFVTIGDVTVELPLKSIQLPISRYSSKSSIATAMGFPDAIMQSGNNELWYWTKYPDMCLEVTPYGSITVHSSWDGSFEQLWKP